MYIANTVRKKQPDVEWWSFDMETFPITHARPVPPGVCGEFWNGSNKPKVLHAKRELSEDGRTSCVDFFEKLIKDDTKGLVGHNLPFDLMVMVKMRPSLTKWVKRAYEQGRLRDTFIRERLIRNRRGHLKTLDVKGSQKLESLAKWYGLRESLDKEEDGWRMRYAKLYNVPIQEWPERAYTYAEEDARVTYELMWEQDDGKQASADEVLQTMATWAAYVVRLSGCYTDQEWVRKQTEALTIESDILGDLLVKEGFLIKNRDGGFSSCKAKVEKAVIAAWEYVGLPPVRNELTEKMRANGDKEGNLSLKGETLEELTNLVHAKRVRMGLEKEASDDGQLSGYVGDTVTRLKNTKDNVFLAYLRYKHITTKLLNTYLNKMIISPVRPYFNPLVATGRMSCSGPNIQNLPQARGIRECIVPKTEGNLICSVDYSTLELRTLGQALYSLFGRSTLGDWYNENPDVDVHAMYAEIAYIKGPYDPLKHKKFRKAAKGPNFGFPGGLGAAKFITYAAGMGISLTIEEAKAEKDRYFEVYPEMREEYFPLIARHTTNYAFEWGDPRRNIKAEFEMPVSGRIRGGCGFSDGANTFFQGGGSDVMKGAAWELCWATVDPNSVLFGCRFFGIIHDEALMEVPPGDKGAACAMEIKRLMEEGGQQWNPDVPLRAEPALCDIWRKEMEYRTHPETGILIPDIYELNEKGIPDMKHKKKDWRHTWDISSLVKETGYDKRKLHLPPMANTVFGDLRGVEL